MSPRYRSKIHLSVCDYCDKKIAWSRRRRQWLALAPNVDLAGKPLRRRLVCAAGPHSLHDPRSNVWTFAQGGVIR